MSCTNVPTLTNLPPERDSHITGRVKPPCPTKTWHFLPVVLWVVVLVGQVVPPVLLQTGIMRRSTGGWWTARRGARVAGVRRGSSQWRSQALAGEIGPEQRKTDRRR